MSNLYLEYLNDINRKLIRNGIRLPLDLSVDNTHIFSQFRVLEDYVYFNHILEMCDSGHKIPSLVCNSEVSYVEWMKSQIKAEYEEVWKSELLRLVEQPSNAGVLEADIRVLGSGVSLVVKNEEVIIDDEMSAINSFQDIINLSQKDVGFDDDEEEDEEDEYEVDGYFDGYPKSKYKSGYEFEDDEEYSDDDFGFSYNSEDEEYTDEDDYNSNDSEENEYSYEDDDESLDDFGVSYNSDDEYDSDSDYEESEDDEVDFGDDYNSNDSEEEDEYEYDSDDDDVDYGSDEDEDYDESEYSDEDIDFGTDYSSDEDDEYSEDDYSEDEDDDIDFGTDYDEEDEYDYSSYDEEVPFSGINEQHSGNTIDTYKQSPNNGVSKKGYEEEFADTLVRGVNSIISFGRKKFNNNTDFESKDNSKNG